MATTIGASAGSQVGFTACTVCGQAHGRNGDRNTMLANPCKECGAAGLHWGFVTPKPGQKPVRPFNADGSEHWKTCARKPAGVTSTSTILPPIPATPITGETDPRGTLVFDELDARIATVESGIAAVQSEFGGLRTDVDTATETLTKVGEAVSEELTRLRTQVASVVNATPIIIQTPNAGAINIGRQHPMFVNALTMIQAIGDSGFVYLKGEGGSGKSYAAAKFAEALGLPFRPHVCGVTQDTPDMIGFFHAGGGIVRTNVRDGYEYGGLIFLDEIANLSAGAGVALNSLTSNGHAGFPDGLIARHSDCYFAAGDNTAGRGGDELYIRGVLDAATLDRACYVPWNTDWALMAEASGLTYNGPAYKGFPNPVSPRTPSEYADWADYCYRVNQAIATNAGIAAIAGARALQNGAKLLAAGIHTNYQSRESDGLVEYSVIWSHMSEEDAATIKAMI